MSSRTRTASFWLALLGSVGTLAIAGTAYADGWATYDKAFPAMPCHDGWASCIVDGQRITPDMATEGPSDMRVGWFELEPSAAFSPFTGLTEYTGEAPAVAAAEPAEPDVADAGDPGALDPGSDGDAVASAPSEEALEAERAADDAKAAEAAARAAEDEARREQEAARKAQADAERAAAAAAKEEEAQRREAQRLAAEASSAEAARQDELREEAAAAQRKADEAKRQREEADRKEAEQRAAQQAAQKKADEEERKRQDAEAAAAKAEEEAREKAEADRKRREAEEATRQAELQAEQERKAKDDAEKKAEAERKAQEEADEKAAAAAAAAEGDAVAEGAAPPPPPGDGSCDNLQALEPAAMLGKMSPGQTQCLEGSLSAASKMTEKKKISVMLMTNAFSKGDKKLWEDLVKRHLDEIDQSDPDLCYKYALYLAGKGAARASGVIRWANVALENRTVWTGDTYKSRVNSLYKMRAAAAQKLWQSAEQEHASSPSDATSGKIEKYRGTTKVYAREWYEYAKISGKDTSKPLQLCMSAAGTSDYCDGG